MMAIRAEDIRVVSYITAGGEPVALDALPQETRARVARQLLLTFLNSLFRGEAVFEEVRKNDGDQ